MYLYSTLLLAHSLYLSYYTNIGHDFRTDLLQYITKRSKLDSQCEQVRLSLAGLVTMMDLLSTGYRAITMCTRLEVVISMLVICLIAIIIWPLADGPRYVCKGPKYRLPPVVGTGRRPLGPQERRERLAIERGFQIRTLGGISWKIAVYEYLCSGKLEALCL